MPALFSRTLRSLEGKGTASRAVALTAAPLVLAWAGWFVCGKVTVYEVTEKARLEVVRAARPVAAQVGGRVVETRLTIGREVREGDVLVVLDSEAERLALGEKKVRRDAFAARLRALRAEVRAEREALAAQEGARDAAGGEAQAQVAQAEAQARFAEAQLEASQQL